MEILNRSVSRRKPFYAIHRNRHTSVVVNVSAASLTPARTCDEVSRLPVLIRMMNSRPFFSIVVPTWNRSALTVQTLRSLVNQDFPRSQYEVIVVDDGSTDDTIERLKEFSDRIRLIQQPNLGAATARNRGIEQAAGEYIVSFDSDDLLLPNALRVYKAVLDSCGKPPVVLAQLLWFRGEQWPRDGARPCAQIRCVRCRDYFAKNVPVALTNSILVVQRSEILRVGAYDRDSGALEDENLLFKLGTAGPLVRILEPVTVGHRLHDQNIRRNLELVSRSYVTHMRNERRGVYPGGWRRMIDRRGLIALALLSNIKSLYLRGRPTPLRDRLMPIPGLLLHARGMLLAAVVRKACSYFYSKEALTVEFPATKNEIDSTTQNISDPAAL